MKHQKVPPPPPPIQRENIKSKTGKYIQGDLKLSFIYIIVHKKSSIFTKVLEGGESHFLIFSLKMTNVLFRVRDCITSKQTEQVKCDTPHSEILPALNMLNFE